MFAILIVNMATIYGIANYIIPYLTSEERQKQLFVAHVFRVNESNEMDNMD